MKGHFSFKLGQSESSADLPTAMSSNSSLAAHHPSTSGQQQPQQTSTTATNSSNSKSAKSQKTSSSSKKIDFKDTKSLKSVKSESSGTSYFAGSSSIKSGDEVIKSNKSQKSKKESGSRRYNEGTPVYRAGQSKPRSRFSLRNLLYSNPLRSNPFLSGAVSGITGGVGIGSSSGAGSSHGGSRSGGGGGGGRCSGNKEADTGSEGSWMDRESQGTVSSGHQNQHHNNQDQASHGSESLMRECVLCVSEYTNDQFPALLNCSHLSCIFCLQQYVRIEVQEGRANLKCPQCSQQIHPNDIEYLIGEDMSLLGLYQFLMVRRVLAADPDTRWCPAPNCTYAVIATGCASCPKIDCEREGCNFSFCYHCKAEWHPNITCDQARAKRHPVRSGSEDSGVNSGGGLEVKVCPRCSVLIVKMDDGSCNHMTCAVCGSEFCWLCMKEISDLHYLSPSGCTFWGKKPWSRKKKLLWQLGTIVGAPVGIALIAGISIPAMVIGIPVWVGRRIKSKHIFSSKPRRITAIAAGVVSSVCVSPILAALVVCVGVPCLLAYVYGVVPFSLCRSGGCGLSTTTQGVRIDVDEDTAAAAAASGSGIFRSTTSSGKAQQQLQEKQQSHSGGNRVANPSIGELSLGASLSMGSGSHLDRLTECDRESASNTAIAGYSLTGSVASSYLGQHRLEVGADVHPRKKFSFSSERLSETVSLSEKSATVSLGDDGAASTRALAGSILQYKMENTSVNSYKTGQATPGSSVSAGTNQDIIEGGCGVSYRPDTDLSLYPSGDEISVRSVPSGLRSLSPVHGEDVTAALRRSRGRRILEKQHSENSGGDEISGGGGSRGDNSSNRAGSSEGGPGIEAGVRFDCHVSYLETSPDTGAAGAHTGTSGSGLTSQDNTSTSERARLVIKKGDLDPETLREETAEELAMVVSPLTPRARSASPLDPTNNSFLMNSGLQLKLLSEDVMLEPMELTTLSVSTPTNQKIDLEETLKEEEDDIESPCDSSPTALLSPRARGGPSTPPSSPDQTNISLVQVDGSSSSAATIVETSTPIIVLQHKQESRNSMSSGSTAPLLPEGGGDHTSFDDTDGGPNNTTFASCYSHTSKDAEDSDRMYTTASNSLSINITSSPQPSNINPK